ncbi:MAG: hypothetical protein IIU85_00260 [Rikenellaceae bacterium]|jgi:hypothetical protein|nr:hypothetical protein [Rikenellaceae bacterium]
MRKFLLAAIALVASVALYAQQPTPFNGQIVAPNGKGMKAQLSIKGTDLAANADKQGRFGFTSLNADDILEIKCNKQVREVKVEGRQSMRIIWGEEGVEVSEDPQLVSEGNDWVKRREYLNDMSKIMGVDLRRSGAHSLISALRARVPSLEIDDQGRVIIHRGSVQKSSGGIGDRAPINFNALIVVDGQEIQSLNDISLFDVGMIKILDEAPLYGFRGVNGVIEITSEASLKKQ